MRIESLRTRAVSALVLLAVMTAAPIVLAQAPKKPAKKKGAKPAATAPAEAPVEPAPPPPEPTPAPEPTPPPAPAVEAVPTDAPKEAPPEENPNDPTEKPGEKYTFVGLRYRATVIPKFILNLFVDEGATILSHEIGIEYEIRKDGFSFIPWLSYATYGTGDILFHEKNQPVAAQWTSVVNSSLSTLTVGADLLWSTELSNKVAIEYGAGAGLGWVFGDLQNNWVYANGTGTLVDSSGNHYTQCPNTGAGPGCDPKNHQNATTAKVGGYSEPSWFSGGSRPALFPHFALPEVGVRFKPVKQFAARATIGFSITGFFFGLSGSYGLPVKAAPKGPTSNPPLANSSEEKSE